VKFGVLTVTFNFPVDNRKSEPPFEESQGTFYVLGTGVAFRSALSAKFFFQFALSAMEGSKMEYAAED
jgi:hypothetical protein